MIFCVLAFGANLLYTASSKSSSPRLPKASKTEAAAKTVADRQGRSTKISEALLSPKALLPMAMPQATPTPEGIATYESTCTTPKTAFVLGETICAKATGLNPALPRSVTWSNPGSIVVARTDILSDTDTFMIPLDETYAIDNQFGDNRGVWQVKLVPVGRSVVRANAFFTVSSANKAADLTVYNSVTDPIGDVPAGGDITVNLTVTNNGPDAVPEIVLTELVPSNATFVSACQNGVDCFGDNPNTFTGPTFTCTNPSPGGTGASVCTIASLAVNAQAAFTFVYNINGTAPKGTLIASTATIAQANMPATVVSELNSRDNLWTARAIVSSNTNTPSGCTLTCPTNMIVTAQSASGAVVTFDAAEPGGTCGTITATPASGSLFPVGTTTVTSNAGGGGTCTFTVTVVETPAPTITCQADQTAAASGNDLETSVSLNTPSTTGNGVILDHSARSDNRPLTDPYPVGTTIITWIATETFGTDPETNEPIEGRSVSCQQKIIVTSPSAPTISCPTDKTFNAASGCEITVTAGQIGTPTTTGSGTLTVTSRRSDDLALTDPFPAGNTTITWTVADGIGRQASCTQVIHVTTSGGGDTTPPTLNVPPNVSTTTNTCSALLDDELGVATADDNCTSSVNITRTGVPRVACPSDLINGCESFIFQTGVTTITYTATDAAGNSTVKTQTVTVTEATPVPPTISAPPNVTLNTGPGATSCGLTITDLDAALGTATASDNCALDSVTRTNLPAGNTFPVGPTVITYVAKDKSGNTASANQTVTVVDNTVPTITAPAAVTLYTGPGATSCVVNVANLDATLGTATASDNCPGVTAARTGGVPAGNNFPKGNTTLTYTATDAHGNTATATQVVTVVDNTPPVITLNGQNISLWPPNHKYRTVNVTDLVASASDNCDASVNLSKVVISQVTSDEIENGNGDGNTTNDIVIAANCKSVQLRSERDGNGDGRVYTITFKVTDADNNVTTVTAKVTVPKNQNGSSAIDSGVHYTVTGTCP
ncbi:MAG TPA: HYR domain-containing protein [Pyrinomonadaceae bacterium]|jgi:hypothetical protein